MIELFLDVETTTRNKGHPFNPDNQLVSYAYSNGGAVTFQYFSDPEFKSHLGKALASSTDIVGFAIKFDLHWVRNVLGFKPVNHRIWDCQLAEFVLNNQQGAYLSLDEALESYGLPLKDDKVKEYWDAGVDTKDIPVPILEKYNKIDIISTKALYDAQRAVMTEKQINLVYLLGEDMKTLLEAEFNGIKWDEVKAIEKAKALSEEISGYNKRLTSYLPPITYGRFNWDSGDHLSALIYGGTIEFDYVTSEPSVYKSGDKKGQSYIKNSWHVEEVVFPGHFDPLPRTELKKTKNKVNVKTRLYKTDEPTLLSLKSRRKEAKELISILVSRSEKLKVGEMIASIEKKRKDLNWTDGMVHAQFNQNVVITGRLSSSNPNMQNTPLEVDELLVSAYAG